jgi:propanol-preferring alcohol dehydrogenase
MKAAVLRELGGPIVIEEVERPRPEAGEVLIRVEACGVCHSDLHLALGDWEMLRGITKLPLIGGHEIVGRVVEIGDEAQGVQIGDRVGVPWLHWTCGECEYCRAGRETLCGKQKITGCMVDGGFAEFVKAPASHVAKLPDSLPSQEAAPLLCAGLTVYKALKTSAIGAAERLAVFGIGGLGHLAVQIGRAMGAEVCAIDVSDEKLALARELGAEWTVNAASEQVHKRVKSIGGAHVALVTSASAKAYETALRSLRKGGTLAVVGMPNEPFSVSAVALVAGETRIVASSVGTREDLRELFRLVEKFPIRSHVESRRLEELPAVFEEMKVGKILGRVVLATETHG